MVTKTIASGVVQTEPMHIVLGGAYESIVLLSIITDGLECLFDCA